MEAAAATSTADDDAPRKPPAWNMTRLTLSVLGHSQFSSVVRSVLLLMSFIMVFHNLVLQSWGIGTFASITARADRFGEQGLFEYYTPLYDAEGKYSFLDYARTPAGRFMHILPAGLWSVIAPLQLSPTFRAKHRATHRRLGRLFVLVSISISLGIVPTIWNVASILPCSVIDIGRLASVVTAVYFLVTGLVAVIHARNRRFANHRVWILRHVAMGYSVHLQRLLGGLSWWVFPRVMPGYTELTPEGAQLRRDIFGLYFLVSVALSVLSMELWLLHTNSAGAVVVVAHHMGPGPKKATAKKTSHHAAAD